MAAGSVLVTGASKRIGREIALHFAEQGFFVWIHYGENGDAARELCEEIEKRGGSAETIHADLACTDDIDAMMRDICSSPHFPDTVIHNASRFTAGKLFETEAAEWDRLFNVNLRAPWYLATLYDKALRERQLHEPCSMIMVSDAHGDAVYTSYAVYGLTRYALRHLVRQLADSFAGRVRVNEIRLGAILKSEIGSDAEWERIDQKRLTPEAGSIDAVLQTIDYVNANPYLTASSITVDGGINLYR